MVNTRRGGAAAVTFVTCLGMLAGCGGGGDNNNNAGPRLSAAYVVRHRTGDRLNYNEAYSQTTLTDGQITDTSSGTNSGISDISGILDVEHFDTQTTVTLDGVPVQRTEPIVINGAGEFDRGEFPLYYTLDDNGFALYGRDRVGYYSREVAGTYRITPALRIPFNLTPGQSVTQDVQATYGGTFLRTTPPLRSPGAVRYQVTFAGIESITVPAGTFSCAKVIITSTYRIAADATQQGEDVSRTETGWYAPNIGLVRIIADSETYDPALPTVRTGRRNDFTLSSARINGTSYP